MTSMLLFESTLEMSTGVQSPRPDRKKRKTTYYINDQFDPERRRLECVHRDSSNPTLLPNKASIGAGIFDLSNEHVVAFADLHRRIVSCVGVGVTWGEGKNSVDVRRRMYGFMPKKRKELDDSGIQIQREGIIADDAEHRQTMKTACIDLSVAEETGEKQQTLLVDKNCWSALVAISDRVRDLVPARYQKFASVDKLIALQPNLHNGASYLPLHLDFPRNDGFGIIIVTVAIQGHGTVVLLDEGDEGEEPQSWNFHLAPGQCYVLCGDARNKCVHGVLCDAEDSEKVEGLPRETLNLRYGLHSEEFAYSEIDQHWPD